MSLPTSAIPGHEYLAFLSDQNYWPQAGDENVYAEEVVLQVDGQPYEQLELTPETIGEHSQVVIVSGHVFEGMAPLHTLQEHFDSWRAASVEQPAPR